MKPYMAFSRDAGPAEGAILVIADSAKQARVLAWRSGDCLNVDGWIDQAVLLIRDNSILHLADQAKLQAGKPHVIWDPVGCQSCGMWGAGITFDNLCCECNQYPGDELIRRLTTACTRIATAPALEASCAGDGGF